MQIAAIVSLFVFICTSATVAYFFMFVDADRAEDSVVWFVTFHVILMLVSFGATAVTTIINLLN